jgi:uncharacterized protein (TIGR02001 family)
MGARLGPALRAAAFALILFLGHPAQAQLSASLSIDSDDRYRGVSLSNQKPDASLNLSYDAANGVYAAASAVASQNRQGGVQMLGYLASVGYSARVNTRLSWDVGFTDTRLMQDYSGRGWRLKRSVDYTQVYVGLITDHVSARVYYSPDYFDEHHSAVYAEVDSGLRLAPHWRLFGHAGVTTPFGGRTSAPGARRETWDLRAGAAASRGHWEARIYGTTALPYAEYPQGNMQRRNALVLGASWFF